MTAERNPLRHGKGVPAPSFTPPSLTSRSQSSRQSSRPGPAPRRAPIAFLAAVLAAVAGGLGIAERALADGVPDPWGVRMPSGSNVSTEIGTPFVEGDADDYVTRLAPGQKLTVTVKSTTKGWVPSVRLLRGDGRPVTTASQKVSGATTRVTFTADATDTYKIRIQGVTPSGGGNAPKGSYAISVKSTAQPGGKLSGLRPDAGNQLRFGIPATGGAQLSFSMKYRGGAPSLRGLREPEGGAIPGFASAIQTSAGSVSAKNFLLPAKAAFGEFDLVFDTSPANPPTDVAVTWKVKNPKGEAPRKGTLDRDEPFIQSVTPIAGGGGTIVTVNGTNFKDDAARNGTFRIFVGRHELTTVSATNPSDPRQLRGTVPAGLPFGTYDVIVETETGQVAVEEDAFAVVAPPTVTAIDPQTGPTTGGFEITIAGTGFRPGRMGIKADSGLVPVSITDTTPTSITFVAPPRAAGFTIFEVLDLDTQLSDDLPVNSFEYLAGPSILRLVPGLVPILGGDNVFVRGGNLNANLHVFLETTTPGVFEDVTPSGGFVDATTLQFTAPVRPKGTYNVFIQDVVTPNAPRSATRQLVYFSFADFTAGLGLTATANESFDGVTTALADFDRDGDLDFFVSRVGGTGVSSLTQTRVLRNGGLGQFTDVTSGANGVMPAPTTDDDWRANRIRVVDVTADEYPDVVIVTNSTTVPIEAKSRIRILVNESRTGASNSPDRVFRDRTIDLMAPPRIMKNYRLGGGSTGPYVSDNWRGQDMWVGDVDAGGGRPEILITHDEVREDSNIQTDQFSSGVYCGNYCSVSGGYSIAYTFYWGGSRAFVWDGNANGGKGRYKFDANFFPRKSGVLVPQTGPGGVTTPGCNGQTPCRGKFPPFVGQRLAVERINIEDGKPDIAVLNRNDVTQNAQQISSLQVGLNMFDSVTGSQVKDITPSLTNLGSDFRADTLAIGSTGFPNGNGYGVVTTSKILPGTGTSVLRMFRFLPAATSTDLPTFQEITSTAVPATTTTEKNQASDMRFVDVDDDGDDDLVLLATSPVGTGSAMRILRNVAIGGQVGRFDRSLQPLVESLVTAGEKFEGDVLTIGDIDGDGELDFMTTRNTPGATPRTRAVKTDK